jgi:hypothetical protein
MNLNLFFKLTPARLMLLLAALLFVSPATLAQSPTPSSPAPKVETKPSAPALPTVDEKAEAILKRAIDALGGAAYLNIKSVIGRGLFAQIVGGIASPPATFVDYLIYPDRERTEFKSSGVRSIQTNTGATGWVFDGMTKTISDVKPDGVESFHISVRTSFENLLRDSWRAEGASLAYAGRREAGLARRNEVVRAIYPDGFIAEFEFGAKDGLPAKVSYKRKIKTKEGEDAEVTEEDRIERYLTFNGVQVPFTIDHYRDGEKTSRITYDSVEFNPTIPESLFAKPPNPKAIK